MLPSQRISSLHRIILSTVALPLTDSSGVANVVPLNVKLLSAFAFAPPDDVMTLLLPAFDKLLIATVTATNWLLPFKNLLESPELLPSFEGATIPSVIFDAFNDVMLAPLPLRVELEAQLILHPDNVLLDGLYKKWLSSVSMRSLCCSSCDVRTNCAWQICIINSSSWNIRCV